MSCDLYKDVAKEYICPKVGGYKKRSIDKLKGNTLYGGQMGVNKACNPFDKPTKSELAWDARNNKMKGGDGFSMLPGKSIGGMPTILRYTNTCRPYFPADNKIIGGSKKSKSKKKIGLIEQISMYGKVKNKKHSDILKEINNNCNDCKIKLVGGSPLEMLKSSLAILGQKLAPLGKNSLASLLVILFLDHLYKTKKITQKKKLGGGIKDYISMFVPMSKSNLLVLVSLLLMNHFACKKKTKSQKGGNVIMSEITKILAPLGLNYASASVILVALSQIYHKKQKGGNMSKTVLDAIAPLGKDVFASTGILVLLKKMFELKSRRQSKGRGKQSGGSLSALMSQLKDLIAPLGTDKFLAAAGLVALKKMKNKK